MAYLSKTAALVAALAFSVSVGAVSAQTVGIGSNPQGSAAYGTAAAIAALVSRNSDYNMRVIPQGGPDVTIPLVNTGELEFSVSNSIPVYYAQRGAAMFRDRPQETVRMVAALYNLNVAFFVRAESDIQSMEDLRGRRVATEFTGQRVLHTMQSAILATVGMSVADLDAVPVPSGVRGVDEFDAGGVDATIFSVGSGRVQQAHASVGGLRWLPVPMTDEAQAALVAVAPGSYIEEIQPSESRVGITGPTGVFAGPFLLVAGENTPEDMVYSVTRLIHENAVTLGAADAQFQDFDPANMARDLDIQMHPGAIRFYREIGLLP